MEGLVAECTLVDDMLDDFQWEQGVHGESEVMGAYTYFGLCGECYRGFEVRVRVSNFVTAFL